MDEQLHPKVPGAAHHRRADREWLRRTELLLEAAGFRDLVGTSRKYVIPLLEHLDDLGVTQRVENKRILRKK